MCRGRLPMCFNALPGVGSDSLLQNRVISIFPPFWYIVVDRHTRMKLPEIPIKTNQLMHLYREPCITGVTRKHLTQKCAHARIIILVENKIKNGVFWDVTPCGSCKNLRFGGTSASFIRVTRIGELGITAAVTSNRRTL
jgi:hypothetical protein